MLKSAKYTKAQAKYVDIAPGKNTCSGCTHFQDDSCDIVDGEIKPDGWCKHWSKSNNSRESNMNQELKNRLKRIADWATGKTVAESPENDNVDEGPESLLSIEENLEQGQPPVVKGAQRMSIPRLQRIRDRISFILRSHSAVAAVYSNAAEEAQKEYTARTKNPEQATDKFAADVVFKFINHVAGLYNEALKKKKDNVQAGILLADDLKTVSKNLTNVGWLMLNPSVLEGLVNTTSAWQQRIDELVRAQQLEEAKKFVDESYPIEIIEASTTVPIQQEVSTQQAPTQQEVPVIPAMATPAIASTIDKIRNRLSDIRETVKKK